jgi:hypothetical protein
VEDAAPSSDGGGVATTRPTARRVVVEDDDEVDESKWMLSFSEIQAIVEDMRREEVRVDRTFIRLKPIVL